MRRAFVRPWLCTCLHSVMQCSLYMDIIMYTALILWFLVSTSTLSESLFIKMP